MATTRAERQRRLDEILRRSREDPDRRAGVLEGRAQALRAYRDRHGDRMSSTGLSESLGRERHLLRRALGLRQQRGRK